MRLYRIHNCPVATLSSVDTVKAGPPGPYHLSLSLSPESPTEETQTKGLKTLSLKYSYSSSYQTSWGNDGRRACRGANVTPRLDRRALSGRPSEKLTRRSVEAEPIESRGKGAPSP